MFTNENTYIHRKENFFMMLINSNEDLMRIENYLKHKKLQIIKIDKFNTIKEKFIKLMLPLFSIFSTIFFYYFYIYVNNYLFFNKKKILVEFTSFNRK